MDAKPIGALSLREARRIALAAQGLVKARPLRPARNHPVGIVDRLGLLQIDSVNVLTRAHYMPAFSRLGAYDTALIDRAAWSGRRKLFEYWGHEASLLPVAMHPLLRWRMEAAARGSGTWGNLARFAREQPHRIREAMAEITGRGPLSAAELTGGGKGKGGWWGWSDGKLALEYLFWSGRLGVSARRGAFERVYDLPERFLPDDILALPTPEPADAHRDLVRIAARALGIATAADLSAYFRLSPAAAKPRIAELADAGEVDRVAVEGWPAEAYLWRGAEIPSKTSARRLVSPFDPLLWERPRAERLFGFRYRLEIYTPAHKRVHGYYVLPFLMKDRLVGRVDLKAERAAGSLIVAGAQHEAGSRPDAVAEALMPELAALAGWLRLADIVIAPNGNLAAALARAKASAVSAA